MSSNSIIAILESVKPNESRIPIHPIHFNLIEQNNNKIFFQGDYAKRFGQKQDDLKRHGFFLVPRKELLEKADVIFLLKPLKDDLASMKKGAILIGWCHAVQQIEIAKIAQKRKLTLIAMEAMYENVSNKRIHLFNENNFTAGRAGIEHALTSIPLNYPRDAKIAVITYGVVSQGAVSKLKDLGFNNITVFSRRIPSIIENKFPKVNYEPLLSDKNELFLTSGCSFKKKLLEFDIIVNGIMQDVLNPYHFLSSTDLRDVNNKFIIDLSCDEKMGFDFASATTFDNPTFKVGSNFYYAVENIPTLLWRGISIHISQQLLPILNAFSTNQFSKEMYEILNNATEIKDGKIINKTITEYQQRVGLLTLD